MTAPRGPALRHRLRSSEIRVSGRHAAHTPPVSTLRGAERKQPAARGGGNGSPGDAEALSPHSRSLESQGCALGCAVPSVSCPFPADAVCHLAAGRCGPWGRAPRKPAWRDSQRAVTVACSWGSDPRREHGSGADRTSALCTPTDLRARRLQPTPCPRSLRRAERPPAPSCVTTGTALTCSEPPSAHRKMRTLGLLSRLSPRICRGTREGEPPASSESRQGQSRVDTHRGSKRGPAFEAATGTGVAELQSLVAGGTVTQGG